MTEKLFENIIDNLGKKKEPTLEEQSQKQLEKYAVQPESRGAWKKHVEHTAQQEKEIEKYLTRPKTVTFDPTTQIFTNEDRTIAFKSYEDANKHNKSIGVKKGPTYSGATPEQFGKLAERLERTRQQQGRPTKVGEFEKAFNKVKKPIKKYTPIKIDIPFVSLPAPIAVRRDPQQELRTQRFNKMVEDSEREKLREQSSGLASFLGKKFI